jgi:hypothetical protein
MTLVMLVAQIVVALLLVAGSGLVLALVRGLESPPETLDRPRPLPLLGRARDAASDDLRRAA